MSDYDSIRLRQSARLKIMQGIDLTPAEEHALTDFVGVSSNFREDDGRRRKKPYVRPFKPLIGKLEEIKAMREKGASMETIAKKYMVGETMIREYLIANRIETGKAKQVVKKNLTSGGEHV